MDPIPPRVAAMTYEHVPDPTEVVVFFKTDLRDEARGEEYEEPDARMFEVVSHMPGFLSFKAYTAEDGDRIAVVRFATEDALEAWRSHPEHRVVQARGREFFYRRYWVQVCKVIREYAFSRDETATSE